jgi:hypothetical protein
MFTSLLFNRFLVKAFVQLVPEGESVFALKRDSEVEAKLNEANANVSEATETLEKENEIVADNSLVEEQNATPENNEGGND